MQYSKLKGHANCLYIATICFLIALMCSLFIGCTTTGRTIGVGVCRHDALISAWIAEDAGYDTRMLFGIAKEGGSFHEQAQALIDGKWVSLHASPIEVYTSDTDDHFIPGNGYINPLLFLPQKWKESKIGAGN